MMGKWNRRWSGLRIVGDLELREEVLEHGYKWGWMEGKAKFGVEEAEGNWQTPSSW
jgi:hypothetical protein